MHQLPYSDSLLWLTKHLHPLQGLAAFEVIQHPPPYPLIFDPVVLVWTYAVVVIGKAVTDGLVLRINNHLDPKPARRKRK